MNRRHCKKCGHERGWHYPGCKARGARRSIGEIAAAPRGYWWRRKIMAEWREEENRARRNQEQNDLAAFKKMVPTTRNWSYADFVKAVVETAALRLAIPHHLLMGKMSNFNGNGEAMSDLREVQVLCPECLAMFNTMVGDNTLSVECPCCGAIVQWEEEQDQCE